VRLAAHGTFVGLSANTHLSIGCDVTLSSICGCDCIKGRLSQLIKTIAVVNEVERYGKKTLKTVFVLLAWSHSSCDLLGHSRLRYCAMR